MSDPLDDHRPLSAILQDLCEHDAAEISIGELSERFGQRALAALLFIFGLACFLPLPPGATTVFGLPLVLLAPQLALGARAPWLPRGVRRRVLRVSELRRGLGRAIPWLRRIEAVSRPRLTFLLGRAGQRLVGGVCFVLALVLILPIPLGNLLPALAVSTLSLSLVQRDGLLTLLGLAITGASATVLALAARLIGEFAQTFLELATGA